MNVCRRRAMAAAPKDVRAAAAELADRRAESVRVRPMSPKEVADGQRVVLRVDGKTGMVQVHVGGARGGSCRAAWLRMM